MARIKLGVAFAGGGVRGASHLGMMQALHEHYIYPEVYAGTSAGAVVASLMASGYTPREAYDGFKEMNDNLTDIAYGHLIRGMFTSDSIEGVVAGKALEKKLGEMLQGSQLQSPLSVVTTDIDTGRQVIYTTEYDNEDHWLNEARFNDDKVKVLCITKNNLAEVVRASCSIPSVFVPKKMNGMKLVDGGVTNNLPSDIVWAMGADKVASLDLGYAGAVKTEGILDVAHMSINLLMERVVDSNSDDYGIYLNPQIFDVRALDIHRMEECFERGYNYGLQNIGRIAKMLEEGQRESI